MFRIVVIVVVLLVAGNAYSDNPTPGSGKESQPEHNQPKDSKKPANKDNRGTEGSPFFIKIVDTPKAETKPDKPKTESNEKPSTDGGLRAEAWAAIFAGVMVVIATWQVGLFLRQLRYIRRSLDDATRAADAAQKTADFTRVEFLSTHRPQIRVRRVLLEEDHKTAEISVRYDVVNIGNRPAHITGGIVRVIFWPNDRPFPPLSQFPDDPMESSNIRETTIAAGSKHGMLAQASETTTGEFQFARIWEANNLFFLGFIKHKDDLGNIRETSFYRRYDRELKRFVPVEDRDYEYED